MVYSLIARDWDAIYTGLYVLISILIVAAIVGGIIFGWKIYLERKKRQAENPKPTSDQAPNTAKPFSTKKKVAIVMFALQILGNAGAYMEGGLDVASALARGIGASVFLIVGMVLILTDEAR